MTQHVTRGPESTEEPGGRWAGRLEALVLFPNLVFVGIVVLYLVAAQAGGQRVAPLVQGEKSTEVRIAQLERFLERDPGDTRTAIELARLYQTVGEFPWSYNALLAAERTGSMEPSWRLMLGLAFLELGKNDDSIRVLDGTLRGCRGQQGACSQNVTLKLGMFLRLARTFRERGIDSRQHREAAEKALYEILKPVDVDPDKMRPKAPVPAEKGQERPQKPAKG